MNQDLMERDGLNENDMLVRGIIPIHPSFRIIALARPAGTKGLVSYQKQVVINVFD